MTTEQTKTRAFKTELDPNKEQVQKLNLFCAASRLAFNWGLEHYQKAYRERKANPDLPKVGFNELKKRFRAEYSRPDHPLHWLRSAPSQVIDAAFENLSAAFTRFFDRVKKGIKPYGYPKFKGRDRGNSFRVCSGIDKKTGDGGLSITDRTVYVPKIGAVRLKERDYLPVGKYGGRMTVSTHAGRWYASITTEHVPEQYAEGRPIVGIDVNIRNYATLSTGEVIENPKHLAKQMRRLKILQRRLSRKKKGSKNRAKMKAKLARVHARVANVRSHFQHNLTTRLVREYGVIGVETLAIQKMQQDEPKHDQKRQLNQDIGDAAWYEFRRQLTYKGDWHGTQVVAADTLFPSTQQCSRCGAKTKVSWSKRTCTCSACGLVVDMDVNAAQNLVDVAAAECRRS